MGRVGRIGHIEWPFGSVDRRRNPFLVVHVAHEDNARLCKNDFTWAVPDLTDTSMFVDTR